MDFSPTSVSPPQSPTVQQATDLPSKTPLRALTSRVLDMTSSLDAGDTQSPVVPQARNTESDGGLNSGYEGSDACSAAWYEEMGDIARQDLVESDNASKPSDTSESTDVSLRASPEPPAPARTAASRRPVTEKKKEKERWKSVIDNWRTIEGSDLIKLANDDKELKQ